jgi:acyl-CoA synthetase (AMP-forming)/AMP-acid ligase II
VKGTNIFSGYYKNFEVFDQVFDEEGWLHTGDIGQWLKVCFFFKNSKNYLYFYNKINLFLVNFCLLIERNSKSF